MRIAALSDATGLPVATLKYYLREGLLHPGTATAVNQSAYDDSHIRRARLVRALLELAGRVTAFMRSRCPIPSRATTTRGRRPAAVPRPNTWPT